MGGLHFHVTEIMCIKSFFLFFEICGNLSVGRYSVSGVTSVMDYLKKFSSAPTEMSLTV